MPRAAFFFSPLFSRAILVFGGASLCRAIGKSCAVSPPRHVLLLPERRRRSLTRDHRVRIARILLLRDPECAARLIHLARLLRRTAPWFGNRTGVVRRL